MSKPGFRGACDDAVREDDMTRRHVSDVISAPIENVRTFSPDAPDNGGVPCAVIDLPAEFPIDVTPCSTRVVRVRLGGEPPRIASYLSPHAWPDVPNETRVGTETTIDTGQLSVSISDSAVSFADRQGTTRLTLALDQTRLQPDVLIRLQIVGEQHFYGLGEGGAQ